MGAWGAIIMGFFGAVFAAEIADFLQSNPKVEFS